ncbi:HIT family protein [Brachybacterium sp. AOP43-C2-M15]|uniref:HIT family protein n=1 Tax=Brachybacterium sp. AOP43-C2-M15 TaxID=3457661 RepID=UPI0040332340
MITPPQENPTEEQLAAWRERRRSIGAAVGALAEAGICYQCRDRETGGEILGDQDVILDEPDVRAVLSLDPRAPGHTIVVWTAHVHDFTELTEVQTGRLFTVARDVARAIQESLEGVARVYLVTMCDGPVNHLHLQLIPRYVDSPIGSDRLVDPRGPVLDGPRIAAEIRRAYEATAAHD